MQTKEPLYLTQIEKANSLEKTIEDLYEYGSLYEFNPLFLSKIRPKNTLKVAKSETEPRNNCVSYEDPILFGLNDSELGEGLNYFFMTEEIFTALATNHKACFPWNISFIKEGNKVNFYAEKGDITSILAQIYTYNENITGDLPEDEKEMTKLCLESHIVSENFAAQALSEREPIEYELEEKPEVPTVTKATAQEVNLPKKKLYRYKKIILDSTNVVIVRFCIDAYEEVEGQAIPVLVRAVNDDGKGEWASKWDANSASIKNDIIKDNSIKFLKWLLIAACNNIETIKLAYVVRSNAKKADDHSIIRVENVSVSQTAKFFSFNIKEYLASLNKILNLIKDIDQDSEYIINKAPFKNVLTIYRVPEAQEIIDEDNLEENA